MKNRTLHISKALITVFLMVSVLMPLCWLLMNIQIEDIHKVVYSPQFGNMIWNSLLTAAITTVLSVGLSWLMAWCVSRTGIRYKSFFSVCFTLPMLIPSISHGMGLVLLFGDNGLITNWMGINIGLYGYKGVIMGELLYSFPVAFLMLTDAYRYEDYTVYEAAEVLGLNKMQQLKAITMPNMKKTLISAIFTVFVMVFTDYGVPLMVGGKILTIPVFMYREVIGLLNFSKGIIVGIILLVPAFIAFVVDLRNDGNKNNLTVTRQYEIAENKKRDLLTYAVCICACVMIILPFFAFAYLSIVRQYPVDVSLSLYHMVRALGLGVGGYMLNSITIALVTALAGLLVIYLTAYLTARSKKTLSTLFLHLISMLSLSIPGIVLGLGYVLFFKGSWIYGTLAILVLVNLVHFFSSPYLMAYNSLCRFDDRLEDVADVMGISWFHMLKDVYIPCTLDSMVEMFSYLFVNSMVTISAVSFLANFRNMPLALMIPQFDAQSLIEENAFISLLILMINGCLKIGCIFVKKYIEANEESSVR